VILLVLYFPCLTGCADELIQQFCIPPFFLGGTEFVLTLFFLSDMVVDKEGMTFFF